jgi:hypothetical protein
MHPPLPGDKAAGFIGLVAGAVSILIVVYAIVLLTNKKFEGHGAAPAAGQHAPPAAAAPAPGGHAPATPAPGGPAARAPAAAAPAPAPRH